MYYRFIDNEFIYANIMIGQRRKSLDNSQYGKAKKKIDQIITNIQKKGETLLPTESELCEITKVSRNTIRSVLGDYVQQGLLTRIQGKGTFINENKKKINFLSSFITQPNGESALGSILNDFHINKGIEVVNKSYPYYYFIKKLIKDLINGNSPDVIQVNPVFMKSLIKHELLLEFDSDIKEINANKRFSNELEINKTLEGTYAINWMYSPMMLFYNKKVFSMCGLDPESPPKTLEQMAKYAAIINQKDGYTGMCLPFTNNGVHFLRLYIFFLAFSGGFLDNLGNVVFDTKENIEALTWLQQTYQQSGLQQKNNLYDARILFANDRLGFLIDGPYCRNYFREISNLDNDFDDHYGVTTIPVGPSGKPEGLLLTQALAIPRSAKDIEGGKSFIKHLTSTDMDWDFLFESTGMIPCAWANMDYQIIHDDIVKTSLKQIESATSDIFSHPVLPHMFSLFVAPIAEAVLHGEDIVETLVFMKKLYRNYMQNADSLYLCF